MRSVVLTFRPSSQSRGRAGARARRAPTRTRKSGLRPCCKAAGSLESVAINPSCCPSFSLSFFLFLFHHPISISQTTIPPRIIDDVWHQGRSL